MRSGERRLITETWEMHSSPQVQAYIAKEVGRPCKQWIHEVLACKREAERVKLRTPDFVLLPDVESVGKRLKSDLRIADTLTSVTTHFLKRADSLDSSKTCDKLPEKIPDYPESRRQSRPKRPNAQISLYNLSGLQNSINSPNHNPNPHLNTHLNPHLNLPLAAVTSNPISPYNPHQAHQTFHWLAVATDTNLRTLRDLRGCHAPMLQSLYTRTCQRIQEETGVDQAQIMAYLHYPPSVYQLHVHFKHLAGPGVSHDTLRVHSLPTVLNNLTIDPEYYAKSQLQMPVYIHTELYQAMDQASMTGLIRALEQSAKQPAKQPPTITALPGSTQCTPEKTKESSTHSAMPVPPL